LDGDNFYTFDVLERWGGSDGSRRDNCVFVTTDPDPDSPPIYSYVQLDAEQKTVCAIREKTRISPHACTGAYGFRSWKTLQQSGRRMIALDRRDRDEFYLSTLIGFQTAEYGEQFTIRDVPYEQFVCLGTPFQVRLFCNAFPRINALTDERVIAPQRYRFELEGTLLVKRCDIEGDTRSSPSLPCWTTHPVRVDFVRYLRRLGHWVVVQTALPCVCEADGRMLAHVLQEELHVPFDELVCDTPWDDVTVSVGAKSADSDWEREMGFYNSLIPPRDFHRLDAPTARVGTIRKEVAVVAASADKGGAVGSGDLSGEAFYYRSIPAQVKDLFPLLVEYDRSEPCRWFEMERINGVPVSQLYLSEQLTEGQLEHLIGSLHRLHQTFSLCESPAAAAVVLEADDDDGAWVYANYAPKLQSRFLASPLVYNEVALPGCTALFLQLHERLQQYEAEQRALVGMIHGDPVLTNILINQFGKIKFIDMRGRQGARLSVLGDVFYDWAKLYQSLAGYDEILSDHVVSDAYRSRMMDTLHRCFLQWFTAEQWGWVQVLCQSLLFSLLPMHGDAVKREKYLALCKQLQRTTM